MVLEPIMHLKPWSRTYSNQCGCSLERRTDGGVAYMACDDHARAFRAVCHVLASGRTVVTQRELRRVVGKGDVEGGK